MTQVLDAVQQGDSTAAGELLPLVYDELRKLAAQKLAHEVAGQTLQPTALVHEAWLRLVDSPSQHWNNRGHFFAAAAEAMRRILVENARRKCRIKHGGELERVDMETLDVATASDDDKLLAVSEALDKLAAHDPLGAELIKLRYFAGLPNVEAAKLLGLSERTAAKVLDAGATETGRPYFVMELVRGVRITEYCDENNLSPDERLGLFIKVCHTVQHAHQKGIIHRDIKPSNILVTLHDGVPVPKVIDFGIAKATEGRLTDKTLFTGFQAFLGTPSYMSPEQAALSGLDIDTRSDIYSLGVLLYELLTGKTPFDEKELLASGLDEMRRTIREKEPVRPSTRLRRTSLTRSPSQLVPRHSSLATDLDWIMMKALEKDRTRRYETANGLAMDIQRHLNNELIVARPPSAVYKVRKFVRRNKGLVAGAALLATVLVLGVLVSTWQTVRALRSRQQAEASRELAEQRLYDSLVRQARATRTARRVGYRDEVLQLLKQALALDVPRKHLGELRREVVACLGDFVGLTPTTFTDFPPDTSLRTSVKRTRRIEPRLGRLVGLVFSPNGKHLACLADSGCAIYATDRFERVAEFKEYFPRASAVSFAADSTVIALPLIQQNRVRLWNWARAEEVAVLEDPEAAYGTAFAPDGSFLLTSGFLHARLYQLTVPAERLSLPGHNGGVSAIVFSPDGSRITSVGWDRAVKVRDAATGRLAWESAGLPGNGQHVAYSPNGRLLVTTHQDTQSVWLWDAQTGQRLLELQTGQPGTTWSAQFSPDGQFLTTGSTGSATNDGVKVWAIGSAATGTLGARLEAKLLKSLPGQVWNLVLAPDGQRIAFVDRAHAVRGELYVWDTSGAGSPHLLSKDIRFGSFGQMETFSLNGRHLLIVDTNRSIVTLEVATGNKVASFPTIPSNRRQESTGVSMLSVSPDSSKLAISSPSSLGVDIWEPQDGRLLYSLPEQSGTVYWLAWSPDSQRLAVSRSNGDISVWNLPEVERVLAGLGLNP